MFSGTFRNRTQKNTHQLSIFFHNISNTNRLTAFLTDLLVYSVPGGRVAAEP